MLNLNYRALEILRQEEDKSYAKLPKEIMDFPTCILDEKFDAFIRGGYHVGLPTTMKLFWSTIIKSDYNHNIR